MTHPIDIQERFWQSEAAVQGLLRQLRHVAENSPFYRRLLRRFWKEHDAGAPLDRASFQRIGFTTKDDLRQHFPHGFRAVPMNDIAGYFESSGTSTGDIGSSRCAAWRTADDLARDRARRIAAMRHIDRASVAIVHLPYALTSSALCFHQALQEAGLVPVALDQGQILSSPSRVIDLCEALQASILVTSDPWLLRDIALHERGEDPFLSLPLKAVATVGLPLSAARRRDFGQRFGVDVLPYYGLSELGAVGLPDAGRIAVSEDFLLEIHNPSNPGAAVGEIVVTDLLQRAAPLIRYRTGDVGQLEIGPNGQIHIEIFGRLSEAIPDGEHFLMPTDFQDLFTGLENTSPVHRVTVSGGGNDDPVLVRVDAQQYRDDASERAMLEERLGRLTRHPTQFHVHRLGELFPDAYSQHLHRTAQLSKRMAFHDERRRDWIVTY
jgi:phenylacetate-CoA ligase